MPGFYFSVAGTPHISTTLQGHYTFQHEGQQLVLLPEKAIYWQDQQTLICADLHLGKAGHFRKAGVPIPGNVHWEDLGRLSLLLEAWQPRELLLLGDLFHSDINNEWTFFERWMEQYPRLKVVLVKGNHDILPNAAYEISNLSVVTAPLERGPYSFTHHPTSTSNLYNLAGHIHPSVALQGRGRQRISLPCFYFGLKGGILPAFGRFTGTARITPAPKEAVFGITQDRVIAL